MITTLITCQAISREWHKILTMAQNNGFPKHIIHELKKNSQLKRHELHKYTPHNNKIIYGLLSRSTAPPTKITNLFRKLGLKIAFRPTNTIFQQLTQKPENNNPSLSAIHAIEPM